MEQAKQLVILSSDVLFEHFFSEFARERLSQVVDWHQYSGRDESDLSRKLQAADILMTTWHTPFLKLEMFGPNPRIRLIAHCGGEVKSRLEERVVEHITVTNAAEPMAAPVAEMAIALTLALVRRIPGYVSEMNSGMVRTNESVSHGETLRGRRVGLVGFGRIGQAFARFVAPFKVNLVVSDPWASADAVAAAGGTLIDLDQLLTSSSVVVLAAALTGESRHLLDQRRLALMPDGAYLINVARGGLIDLDALLRELRTGRLSAALDVTDPLEPLPVDHELRHFPNVLLTPHIAAGGIEMRREIGDMAVDEVVRFCKGEPLRNIVTAEMLATMT
jgi:phosphoglycerate dehydrogenase-like enzyme